MSSASKMTSFVGDIRTLPGKHSLAQRLAAIPSMLAAAFRPGRSSTGGRLPLTAALAGLVYAASPLDFIPELFLGPFGLGDDLAIAAVSVAYLLRRSDAFLTATSVPAHADIIEGVVVPQPPTGESADMRGS